MSKTAKGLVEFAEKALKEDWGYCLGTYGNILTPSYLKQKQSQGGGVGAYNTKHNAYLQKFINKRVSDCYGLVKGYVWWQDNNKNPGYVASQDRNQEGAYSSAKEKGPLSTLPEIPGLVLWMKGHAGIYIGNGEFIEIVGIPVGMRKGKIVNGKVTSGSKFTHWFKDAYIDYTAVEVVDIDKLANDVIAGKYGSGDARRKALGDNYRAVQDRVNEILSGKAPIKPSEPKENLIVDGYWGPATTKALQKSLGTTVDGVISGQYRNSITEAIPSVRYGATGSSVVKALQRKVGVKVDGYIGPDTLKALQKYLKTTVDGKLSRPSMVVKELQRQLNQGTF